MSFSSDEESDSSEALVSAARQPSTSGTTRTCSNSSTSRKRSRRYEQSYKLSWEAMPEFKSWLGQYSKDKTQAYCKLCDQKLKPKKCVLLNHLKSEKHVQKSKNSRSNSKIASYFKQGQLREETKKAEIMLCGALAEHNIPFRAMDHISELLARYFHDSAIAKDLNCKRTKSAAIIYKLMAPEFKDTILNQVRARANGKFSFVIDESTDVSTSKSLTIVIKYYNDELFKVETKLLSLVETATGTAEGLFDAITHEFEECELNFEKLIGFSADTTNVMFGENNSVASRIQAANPNVVTVKCVCHSTALAVSYACKVLPRQIEDLVRDIYNYFSQSSKRKKEFAEFQNFSETEQHNLLRLYDIRWLCLHSCVARILEQWAPLKLYFTSQYLIDRVLASERCYSALNDKHSKAYLLFLDFVLPLTNKFNELFQAQYAVLHRLWKEATELFCTLCSYYMKVVYVRETPVQDIDPKMSLQFLPFASMNVGQKTISYLKEANICGVEAQNFFSRCQSFYIELCSQLKVRLPLDNDILKHAYVLRKENFNEPSNAVCQALPLFLHSLAWCSNEERQNADTQLRTMLFDQDVKQLAISCETTEKFWGEIGKLEGIEQGSLKYDVISDIAKNCLCLPISSADCERIFSQVNIIKTKSRNRFKVGNVEKIIQVKQGLGDGGCKSFVPTAQMLEKFNSVQLYDNSSNSDTE